MQTRLVHFAGEATIGEAFWRRDAGPVASAWVARVDAGESIHWSAQATLAADGIAAWSGPHAGTLALYSEIASVEIGAEGALVRLANGAAYVEVPRSHGDFTPGLHALLELLWRTHVGDPEGA